MARWALWIIRVTAWLVPADARSEWRREWSGEVHASTNGARALAFSCGALAHAAWLQKEQWRPDMVMADVRYGWRQLLGAPGVALAAVLTLAIGIGSTTAIFSTVYGVLLKPLPYREPERLVQLWESNPLFNWTEANVAPGNMLSWRDRSHAFESMAWYFGSDTREGGTSVVSLGANGEPSRVNLLSVSTNFFDVLCVAPALGRAFVDGEDVAGRQRVVVLSDAFWRRALGGDAGLVGRTIPLNGRDYLVAGVMPPSFSFDTRSADAWVPMVLDLAKVREVRRAHYLRVVARLKTGVTAATARAELATIARDLEREFPDTNTQMSAGLGPIDDWFVGPARRPLVAFLAAVALVLLIACVNVTNLFLTRNAGRTREMHLRSALGASRLRLVRQLMAEALVVSAAGAAAGVGLAALGLRLFVRLAPPGVPRISEIGINVPVASFAVAVSALAALAVGLVSAWQTSRVDLRGGIGDGTRNVTTSGRRLRRALAGAEVALAVVLLVGASMTLRSFVTLVGMPTGFPVDGLVSARVSLPGVRYGDNGKSATFFEGLAQRLRAEPGVTAAGATSRLPLEGVTWTGQLFIDGRPEVHGREIRHKTVTTGYLEALGLPLRAGRIITLADVVGGQRPVVINATLAKQYFPDGDAVGHRIAFDRPSGDKTRWRTILGVVGDEPQDGLGTTPQPEMYEPEAQVDDSEMSVLVRTTLSDDESMALLRRVLRTADSQLAIFDARSMRDGVERSVARERLAMAVSFVFALSALVLAAVGIFGVAAQTVTARTREIGVRIALGATRTWVMAMILREELRAVVVGLAVGGGAAYAMGRAVTSLLFHVPAGDARSYAAGVLVLSLTALVACVIPARRALRLNPVDALRGD